MEGTVKNEKVISTQALIDKFKQALADKWGYIWGTAGETWTAAKQANLEKTTDADRANSRKYGNKWIGHKVADCSGLFSWAFRQLGGYMYHGSNTMWLKYCTAKGEMRNGKRPSLCCRRGSLNSFYLPEEGEHILLRKYRRNVRAHI